MMNRVCSSKRMAAIVLIGAVACLNNLYAKKNDSLRPVDYVDPWIESGKSRYFYFNSACRPFGMANLSPDTKIYGQWDSGYRYGDEYIEGLTHIRDWGIGGMLVMPTSGDTDPKQGVKGWKSRFSHEGEIVKAGYHKLHLQDFGIDVELTSTERVGFHRYTYQAQKEANILVWLGGRLGGGEMQNAEIKKTSPEEICGWVEIGHPGNPAVLNFVIQFSKAVQSCRAWNDTSDVAPLNDKIDGKGSGIIATFDVKPGDQVLMKVGLSWCGIDQARLNLEAELDHWDFERVKRESFDDWNKWLSKIKVKGGTHEQRVKFYTDIWHALLGRRQIQDVDGKYPDRLRNKWNIRQLPVDDNGRPEFKHFTSDSYWLTKWNLNILWGMAWPQVLEDFCNSSLVIYKDGGRLPRGPVIGAYSDIMTGAPISELIVAAYMKGVRGFDHDMALKAMVHAHSSAGGTMDQYYGVISEYMRLGYVPETGQNFGSAGRTMEYAPQDWALAQYAKELGKDDVYQLFQKRAYNWINVFDIETKFVRPRKGDGTFTEPFDPVRDANRKGFVEANSWQTTWMATHDVRGLVNLMGGVDAYCDKLNLAFEESREAEFVGAYGKGYVSYANQPGLAMAHLFNLAGKPWLSQYWVRQVNDITYGGTTPDSGYGGHDEDQGQMGALSALMSMGLFQARGGCSADSIYEITAPVFDEVEIELDPKFYPGKVFKIKTKNNAPENVYIQSVKLNGKRLENCWFYHRDFVKGGTLEIVLGPEPNKKWGVKELPTSLTAGEPQIEYRLIGDKLPAEVTAGQPLSFDLQISNKGGVGVADASLQLKARPGLVKRLASLNGSNDVAPVDLGEDKFIIKSGQVVTNSYTTRVFCGGVTELILNGKVVREMNVKTIPGKLELLDTEIIDDYGVIRITGRALNAGSKQLKTKLPIKINGAVVHSEKYVLNAGESKLINFEYSVSKSGKHHVEIGNLKELDLDVFEADVGAEPGLVMLLDLDGRHKADSFPDLSGSRNHVKLTGLTGQPAVKPGGGLMFTGRDYLTVEKPQEKLNFDKGFTISFVLKSESQSGNRRVLQQGDDEFCVLFTASTLWVKFRGITDEILSVKDVPFKQWYRLTLSYNSQDGTLQVWRDAEKVAEKKVDGTLQMTADKDLYFGAKNPEAPDGDFFVGQMREIRVYQRGLTGEEIKKMKNSEE